MRFLELTHVDGDNVLLAAVEGFRERQRGFGFTDPGRAAQHKDAHRFVGIVQLRPRGFHAAGNKIQAVTLADNALVQRVSEVEYRVDLVFHHPAQRDPGPVRDHRGNHVFIHRRKQQRFITLQGVQRLLLFRQLAAQLGAIVIARREQRRAQADNLLHQAALFFPAPGQGFAFCFIRVAFGE